MSEKIILQIINNSSGIPAEVDYLEEEVRNHILRNSENIYEGLFFKNNELYEAQVVFFRPVQKIPEGCTSFTTNNFIFCL